MTKNTTKTIHDIQLYCVLHLTNTHRHTLGHVLMFIKTEGDGNYGNPCQHCPDNVLLWFQRHCLKCQVFTPEDRDPWGRISPTGSYLLTHMAAHANLFALCVPDTVMDGHGERCIVNYIFLNVTKNKFYINILLSETFNVETDNLFVLMLTKTWDAGIQSGGAFHLDDAQDARCNTESNKQINTFGHENKTNYFPELWELYVTLHLKIMTWQFDQHLQRHRFTLARDHTPRPPRGILQSSISDASKHEKKKT